VLASAVAGRARIHSEANSQTREIRDRSGASIQRRIVTKESQADPQSLASHVAELDSDERAILDLSLRYGFSDERLAPMLQIELDEVADRREAALSELGERVGVDSGANRQALEQALREVPHDTWVGRELRDPSPERVAPVANGLPPVAGEGDGTAAGEPRRRSRRVIAVLLTLAAVAGVIVLIASGGDGGEPSHGPPASRQVTQPPDAGAAPAAGQGSGHQGGGSANTVSLKPVLGAAPSRATIRLVAAGPPAKITLALRTPTTHPGIYEVWLYDTVIHARPIARIPHGGGKATFTLPADASDYRYIDISEEKAGGFPGHSGRSVERVGLPAALAGLGIG
jgi:hypothetical protein